MIKLVDIKLKPESCKICSFPLDIHAIDQICSDCIGESGNSKKTYVTFGSAHKHKINGKFFDWNCVAVIKCKDAEHGRQLAFEYFGVKFCLEYHEDDFNANMKYFKRGFINVN